MGREFDFPPTSGVWSGWFGLAFVAGTITVIAWHGFTPLGVQFTVGLVLAGVLIYAFMLRPRIQVRGGRVRLVNPFHVVEIPLPLVRSVLVRSATYVFVGERRKKYVGVAVGRDPRDLTRSRNGTWTVSRGSESFAGYRRPDGSSPTAGRAAGARHPRGVGRAARPRRTGARRREATSGSSAP